MYVLSTEVEPELPGVPPSSGSGVLYKTVVSELYPSPSGSGVLALPFPSVPKPAVSVALSCTKAIEH